MFFLKLPIKSEIIDFENNLNISKRENSKISFRHIRKVTKEEVLDELLDEVPGFKINWKFESDATLNPLYRNSILNVLFIR